MELLHEAQTSNKGGPANAGVEGLLCRRPQGKKEGRHARPQVGEELPRQCNWFNHQLIGFNQNIGMLRITVVLILV